MNKIGAIKKAVIYCRVSTREQVEEGNSLVTQERTCRDYCQKNGYEIAGVYQDQGESAKTATRPELQKMLRHCAVRSNGINVVIIYKLDRLTRSTDDFSYLRILLNQYGVKIKSITEHFEDSPVGRFMENIIANVAQLDNDIRAERSVGGMKEAVREGRYVWFAPAGYENFRIAGKTNIRPHPVHGLVVRRAFEMFATGNYRVEDLRRILIEEGLVNTKGKPIAKSYFPRMLTNELYAGWIKKFGERSRGTFTPLVTDEMFQRVQRVYKKRSVKHSIHLKEHPDFPLRKFVTNCKGVALTGAWSSGRTRKYPYYRFGVDGDYHRQEDLHSLFERYLDGFAFNSGHLLRLRALVHKNLVKAMQDREINRSMLEKRVIELKERQSGMIRKNLDGLIPDAAIREELDKVQDEIDDATLSLSQLPDLMVDYEEALESVEGYLQNPGVRWRKASIKIKIKLQWFHFPSGVIFEKNSYGTNKISCIFKLKQAIADHETNEVPFGVELWNQLGKELTILAELISTGTH